MAGYGLWWAVLEVVAARLDSDSHPTVTYPVSTWSGMLSLRGSHLRQAISKLVVTNLVTAEWSDSELTVTIPNLLKYRDEYSRKSGHSQDSVRSKKQNQKADTDTDTDTEADKTQKPIGQLALTHVAPEGETWDSGRSGSFLKRIGWRTGKRDWNIGDQQLYEIASLDVNKLEEGSELETICGLLHEFDLWWVIYWRKVSKKQAREAWFKATWQEVWEGKSWDLVQRIQTSTATQSVAMNKREMDSRPHGATWLNNARWNDEVQK